MTGAGGALVAAKRAGGACVVAARASGRVRSVVAELRADEAGSSGVGNGAGNSVRIARAVGSDTRRLSEVFEAGGGHHGRWHRRLRCGNPVHQRGTMHEQG